MPYTNALPPLFFSKHIRSTSDHNRRYHQWSYSASWHHCIPSENIFTQNGQVKVRLLSPLIIFSCVFFFLFLPQSEWLQLEGHILNVCESVHNDNK